MRKKCSRQKEVRVLRERKCSLCLSRPVPSSVMQLPTTNLKKKYYFPQVETYHFRTANNLIYDPCSREAIEVAEMNKLACTMETLKGYHTFSETVQMIRGVVEKRVEQDFYGWVDFHREHYFITNSYYVRRKQLVQNNQKMQQYLKNTPHIAHNPVRQYFQDKVRRELDHQRLVKLTENDTNSSTIDLQRLTRHLDNMIEKIADLSAIRPHAQFRLKPTVPESNVSLLFRINSCGDISAIGKNRLPTSTPLEKAGNYQQTYGLENIKPKHNGKGKKSTKTTLKSTDKVTGNDEKQAPQTPKPRFFHTGNQYEEIEINKPGNWKRTRPSRDKKMVPMSPNNHSSSSRHTKISRNVSQQSSKGGRK